MDRKGRGGINFAGLVILRHSTARQAWHGIGMVYDIGMARQKQKSSFHYFFFFKKNLPPPHPFFFPSHVFQEAGGFNLQTFVTEPGNGTESQHGNGNGKKEKSGMGGWGLVWFFWSVH